MISSLNQVVKGHLCMSCGACFNSCEKVIDQEGLKLPQFSPEITSDQELFDSVWNNLPQIRQEQTVINTSVISWLSKDSQDIRKIIESALKSTCRRMFFIIFCPLAEAEDCKTL